MSQLLLLLDHPSEPPHRRLLADALARHDHVVLAESAQALQEPCGRQRDSPSRAGSNAPPVVMKSLHHHG
jgi:hypothetical protein